MHLHYSVFIRVNLISPVKWILKYTDKFFFFLVFKGRGKHCLQEKCLSLNRPWLSYNTYVYSNLFCTICMLYLLISRHRDLHKQKQTEKQSYPFIFLSAFRSLTQLCLKWSIQLLQSRSDKTKPALIKHNLCKTNLCFCRKDITFHFVSGQGEQFKKHDN